MHGVAQLERECGDFVERKVELLQCWTGNIRVKGQLRANAVTRGVQHAQRGQRQQLLWQRLELIPLQV